MKRWFVVVGMVLLLVPYVQGQGLGDLFGQSGKILKEYGRQVEWQRLLIESTEAGDEVKEEGLDTIGFIRQVEFDLHRNFFNDLSLVKDAVAGMPEVGASAMLAGMMRDRMDKVQKSWVGVLPAAEYGTVVRVFENLRARIVEEQGDLRDMITAGRVVTTDNVRMVRIRAGYDKLNVQWGFLDLFIGRVEWVIGQRKGLQADGGSVRDMY